MHDRIVRENGLQCGRQTVENDIHADVRLYADCENARKENTMISMRYSVIS